LKVTTHGHNDLIGGIAESLERQQNGSY